MPSILRRIGDTILAPRDPYAVATPTFSGGQIPGASPSADNDPSVYASAAPMPPDAIAPNSAPPPLSNPDAVSLGAVPTDQDLERLRQIYRQGAPAPPVHGRLATLAEGLAGRFLPNAQAVLHPEYAREVAAYQRGLQAASGAAKASQAEAAMDYQRAQSGHLKAETANMPALSIEAASRAGWVPDEDQGPGAPPPLSSPDGNVADEEQAAMAHPLPNRPKPKGASLTIGGVQGHFETAGEKRLQAEQAKQANWQEVPPEMADALKDIGVTAGQKVDPATYRSYAKLMQQKQQQPNLVFKDFTNEKSGDVTVIGFDPKTMQEKSRQVIKGVAEKRPSIAMMGGGLSDDAVELEARKYLQTGQMPALGMGGSQMKQKILDRAATIAKTEGVKPEDVAAQGAQFKAGAGSLSSLQKQQQAVLAFERTALSNLDLANGISQQVDRTGSPLLNRYLLYLKGGVAGDTQTIKLQNAVRTAANEYAKVISGSMGNTAVTDSLRKETESMLNSSFSKGTFNDVVALMKQEMANRKSGYAAQIEDLKKGIRQKPGQSGGGDSSSSVVDDLVKKYGGR